MLKKLLIVFVALVVLLIAVITVLSFITTTEIRVERETIIDRPSSDVFAYVKLLRNQNEWGPWFKKEPTMYQEFRGIDGTPGFVVYWKGEGNETGEGEQEITRIVEGERIETELRFKQPFDSRADVHFISESIDPTKTRVKWGIASSMPRPMNLIMLVIDMDKEIGKDFDEGLSALKSILEAGS